MNARKKVEEDIKYSINTTLQKGILVNPRISGKFYNDNKKITSRYTLFSDEQDYIERSPKKYEDGEYLAAFPDGGFLQINYEFNYKSKNVSFLTKMNLCYLPPVKDDKILNEYIRIDYTNSKDNSFFHPCAHLHIGFRNSLRLPLEEVTLFSEFMRIILHLFYPKYFVEIFKNQYRTTHTQIKAIGKLTQVAVLTQELAVNYYLKILT